MRELDSKEKLLKILKENREKKLFIFKHSTRCPISAGAYEEYKRFISKHPEVDFAMIDVLAHRDVSDLLSQQTNIKHESPQVFLFQNGRLIWNTSHGNITEKALEKHV